MIARIKDNRFIYLENITVPEEEVIYKAFSVQDPQSRFIDTSAGLFDGWYRRYNRKLKRLALPFLKQLKLVCSKYDLPLSVNDDRGDLLYRSPDLNSITKDLLPGISLEDYQIDATKAMCREEIGLIDAPTGSGKGELIAAITKLMNCPTAIICDQDIAIRQLKQRLELREVAEEIGLFCSGKLPSGEQVICGLIQSVCVPNQPKRTSKDIDESYNLKLKGYMARRQNALAIQQQIAKCDMIIIDEADKASSNQFGDLFRYWFKGRRRYGFSGSVFDRSKPVENMFVRERLGSVIYSIDRQSVQATGRIIPVRYTAIAYGNPANKNNRSTFDEATREHIIENKQFHELVVRITNMCLKRGGPQHGILILVESIPLGKSLEALISNSRFIYGATPRKLRAEVVKQFEDREINVLIGGKILGRALDLKGGCETLILATGGKLWSKFIQWVGRAIRMNKAGKADIYDFYFFNNHYLYNHSRQRLKSLTSMGYPGRIIFPTGAIEINAFIKSRFRVPKKS